MKQLFFGLIIILNFSNAWAMQAQRKLGSCYFDLDKVSILLKSAPEVVAKIRSSETTAAEQAHLLSGIVLRACIQNQESRGIFSEKNPVKKYMNRNFRLCDFRTRAADSFFDYNNYQFTAIFNESKITSGIAQVKLKQDPSSDLPMTISALIYLYEISPTATDFCDILASK